MEIMPVTPVVNQDPQYSDSASKKLGRRSSSPCYDVAGDIAQTVDDTAARPTSRPPRTRNRRTSSSSSPTTAG